MQDESVSTQASFEELRRPSWAIHALPGELAFWSYAGFGAAIVGGLFGVKCGFLGNALLGMMFGFGFALLAALPVFLTVGVATWALWLSRFRFLTSALAGGMTLFASVKFLEMPGLEFRDMTWIFGHWNNTEIAAAICGAVGSPLVGGLFCFRMKYRKKARVEKKPWQFSLRDLFIHFTVLALMISLWTWFFTYLREVKDQRPSAPRQTGKP